MSQYHELDKNGLFVIAIKRAFIKDLWYKSERFLKQ